MTRRRTECKKVFLRYAILLLVGILSLNNWWKEREIVAWRKIEEAVYKILPKEKERERERRRGKKRRMIQIKVLERGPNDVYKATSGETQNGLCSLALSQLQQSPHFLIISCFFYETLSHFKLKDQQPKNWLGGKKPNTMAVCHAFVPFFLPNAPHNNTRERLVISNWNPTGQFKIPILGHPRCHTLTLFQTIEV